jgi:hypothetical protein
MKYANTWQAHNSGQREDECRGLYNAAESCWDLLARRRAQQLRDRVGTGEDGCQRDSRAEATSPSSSVGCKRLATGSEETLRPSHLIRTTRFPPNLEFPPSVVTTSTIENLPAAMIGGSATILMQQRTPSVALCPLALSISEDLRRLSDTSSASVKLRF